MISMSMIRGLAILGLGVLGAGCQATTSVDKPQAPGRTITTAVKAPEEASIPNRVALYECPIHGDVLVRYSFGEVTLVLKDRSIVLPQAVAASGTRFTENGNLFWEKTPHAQVSLDGKAVEECTLDSARAPWVDAWRRGVSFRAQGTTPAWWAEVLDGDHITLAIEDGTHIIRGPAEPPILKDGARYYESDSDEGKLTVSIAPKACKISGLDMNFPNTVTVTLHDMTYTGCGKPAERDP